LRPNLELGRIEIRRLGVQDVLGELEHVLGDGDVGEFVGSQPSESWKLADKARIKQSVSGEGVFGVAPGAKKSDFRFESRRLCAISGPPNCPSSTANLYIAWLD
jgi:hypothetical protein